MNKTFLINASIVVIIIGFVFSVYFFQKKEYKQNNYLTINGTIQSIKKSSNIFIINFKPDILPVISFKNISYKKGDSVQLKGRLQNYNGKLEFVLK